MGQRPFPMSFEALARPLGQPLDDAGGQRACGPWGLR